MLRPELLTRLDLVHDDDVSSHRCGSDNMPALAEKSASIKPYNQASSVRTRHGRKNYDSKSSCWICDWIFRSNMGGNNNRDKREQA